MFVLALMYTVLCIEYLQIEFPVGDWNIFVGPYKE